ncbi:helix-turn-helix domain-containing protein [Paenibacillus sp. MMO-58]|uniref:helix-turn-helix domain-containing protein n=1 Tax=Paenibacillus sp. MMO-58 TaxID=3081290 RepID=UPI003015F0F5
MNSEFGQYLKELRLARNYSLREAGNISGLSHGYIRDVELGSNRNKGSIIIPGPKTLQKFSAAYGVSFNELMVRAGHLPLTRIENIQHVAVNVELMNCLYVQVDCQSIINYHFIDSVVQETRSLFDYLQLEELLLTYEFSRVKSGLFINKNSIKDFDDTTMKIQFGYNKSLKIPESHYYLLKDSLNKKLTSNNLVFIHSNDYAEV